MLLRCLYSMESTNNYIRIAGRIPVLLVTVLQNTEYSASAVFQLQIGSFTGSAVPETRVN